VVGQPRSSQRFEGKPRTDEAPLVKRMLQLSRAKPRYGYRRIGWLLRSEGWHVGLSRVFRLWQREGLKVPVKKRIKRRLGSMPVALQHGHFRVLACTFADTAWRHFRHRHGASHVPRGSRMPTPTDRLLAA
jgi:transposase InsO family protein